jgi:hypothetical protein
MVRDLNVPISLQEASTLYPVTYETLERAAETGSLRAERAGDRWTTTREAVEESLADGRLPSSGPSEAQ